MAFDHPDWKLVKKTLSQSEQLYRRVEKPVTELNEETGQETTRSVVSYEKVAPPKEAVAAFQRVEADVERMVQELQSYQLIERELRNAMDADNAPGAQVQRR